MQIVDPMAEKPYTFRFVGKNGVKESADVQHLLQNNLADLKMEFLSDETLFKLSYIQSDQRMLERFNS